MYLFLSTGYWHGCSVSCSEHRVYIQLPETSFGSTRTIPWCFTIFFIVKLIDRVFSQKKKLIDRVGQFWFYGSLSFTLYERNGRCKCVMADAAFHLAVVDLNFDCRLSS
jgi:hypothetical protein